jgi:sensor histidine kinase regulating citrate/malate metabolism
MQKTGMVVVQVENPYEGELELRDGLPKTVKQNEPGYHGYGLKSIRDTVEKYGGYLTVETEGQVFLLRLLFPDGNKKM